MVRWSSRRRRQWCQAGGVAARSGQVEVFALDGLDHQAAHETPQGGVLQVGLDPDGGAGDPGEGTEGEEDVGRVHRGSADVGADVEFATDLVQGAMGQDCPDAGQGSFVPLRRAHGVTRHSRAMSSAAPSRRRAPRRRATSSIGMPPS